MKNNMKLALERDGKLDQLEAQTGFVRKKFVRFYCFSAFISNRNSK